jgi:hypothetical protein
MISIPDDWTLSLFERGHPTAAQQWPQGLGGSLGDGTESNLGNPSRTGLQPEVTSSRSPNHPIQPVAHALKLLAS